MPDQPQALNFLTGTECIMTPLTVTGTAVGLTMPTGFTPRHAIIACETAAVRYGPSSDPPTTAQGTPMAVGEKLDLTDPMGDFWGFLKRIQFIATGSNATIQCTFFD